MRQNEVLRSIHDELLEPLDGLRNVYNTSLSGTAKAFREGLVTGYAKCLTRYEDSMKKHTSNTSEDICLLETWENRIREYHDVLINKILCVRIKYYDVYMLFGDCEKTRELESEIEGLSESVCLLLDVFKEVFCDEEPS